MTTLTIDDREIPSTCPFSRIACRVMREYSVVSNIAMRFSEWSSPSLWYHGNSLHCKSFTYVYMLKLLRPPDRHRPCLILTSTYSYVHTTHCIKFPQMMATFIDNPSSTHSRMSLCLCVCWNRSVTPYKERQAFMCMWWHVAFDENLRPVTDKWGARVWGIRR